ncbi:hypothetical protein HHI36_011525 [Cryptolaemus montrouzieri]|uniref:MYND-type domain-containing protein n=1 Tax=Cryptolaemus montrouzieri TaxID=559131 RepID=A0ABD2MM01_9CUCU
MNKIDLGYLEPCEKWQVESRLFPSKAGGKPAWLNLEGIPRGEDLLCSTCGENLIFLCQIYAPYEEDDNNFHRTLFIFICRNANCCIRNKSDNIRIFRSHLTRDNKFYPSDPPVEGPDPDFSLSKWSSICEACGSFGDKKCSNCKVVTYCSRKHQIIHWKENHKKTCGTKENTSGDSSILFPEFEIVIEPEVLNVKEIDEEQEKQKFIELQKQGKLGTMSDLDEEELTKHSTTSNDKMFAKFRKCVENNPEQVLRYSRGDQPLLISDDIIPENIPDCEYCGGPRQFEFQIMPQMLTFLKETQLDWGVLICYTCKFSCTDINVDYKREFVFKQDVSLSNI